MSFNKYPSIKVNAQNDHCILGWDAISRHLKNEINTKNRPCQIVIDGYTGVYWGLIVAFLQKNFDDIQLIHTADYLKSESEIREMTQPAVTDHRIFGKMSSLCISDFFQIDKIAAFKESNSKASKNYIIVGIGASLLCDAPDIYVYADMPRWEIQQRMRRGAVNNIGITDANEPVERQYKRAYFVDWRVCDAHKNTHMNSWHYILDSTNHEAPKLVHNNAVLEAYAQAVKQPFSVVPFFDAGPWGGQWMKETFDLDKNTPNYAWCFNCVPEENSLLIEFANAIVEVPSINLVFNKPKALLGEMVFEQFGAEFPIRFDFLDTMQGGNLSLQVHPTKDYIKKEFGMPYTQDESYYLLDAGEDAFVYLGLNENVESDEMITDLKKAQSGESGFQADKYVRKWVAKKHDHFLIPAGTIHCSGKNSMVLEISATPYIFTFKLWDWGRLGMDGRPRPISIEHGENVIDWNRTESWCEEHLINNIQILDEGEGWIEESTGLHESQFIQTNRLWFSVKTFHNTHKNLNVLMLIEGDRAIIESPLNKFQPFEINYAEAIIIPAQLGEYTIRPFGESKKYAIIKAFVKP